MLHRHDWTMLSWGHIDVHWEDEFILHTDTYANILCGKCGKTKRLTVKSAVLTAEAVEEWLDANRVKHGRLED